MRISELAPRQRRVAFWLRVALSLVWGFGIGLLSRLEVPFSDTLKWALLASSTCIWGFWGLRFADWLALRVRPFHRKDGWTGRSPNPMAEDDWNECPNCGSKGSLRVPTHGQKHPQIDKGVYRHIGSAYTYGIVAHCSGCGSQVLIPVYVGCRGVTYRIQEFDAIVLNPGKGA